MKNPFSGFGGLQPGTDATNAATAAAANASGSAFPPGIMDNLLMSAGRSSPLLQVGLFFYRTLGVQLGVDPSALLTIVGLLWGLSKLGSQLWQSGAEFLDKHFMCAIYIAEGDHIYTHIMKWLSQQPAVEDNQYLTAQTEVQSAWEDEGEQGLESLLWTDGGEGDGQGRYLNFSNQEARLSPRYVPAPGTTSFWHKGRYFRVTRKKESLMTGGWSGMKDVEELKIACFGRSITPIKNLLAEARQTYYNDTSQKTTIYRPKTKETRRNWNMWQTVARRPVRPMSTVVLDSSEKHSVLVDLNEYLHPTTPRWYASRGIPLRRGYLFHGPPGTGKTSFSFALAGVFGLDIYVISLQDINVTEEDLAVLFTQLPRRCIVLLEDIDTAGLRRDAEEEESDDDEKESEEKEGKEKSKKDKTEDGSKTNGEMVNGTEKKKKKSKSKKEKHDDSDDEVAYISEEERHTKGRRGRAGGRSRAVWDRRDPRNMAMTRALAPPESISLSGLLNAIDGVASHEGRVLIMTTNKPESLDEALIRPGRVDMQVAFTKATGAQATELFHRMYEGTQPRMTPSRRSGGTDKSSTNSSSEKQKKSRPVAPQEVNGEGKEEISSAELKDLSQKFGKLVPADTFSPAEIQGFLLKRKKTPKKALDDADDWIEATLKQKEAKSKVVTVQ